MADRESLVSDEDSNRRRIGGFVKDSRTKTEAKRSDRAPNDFFSRLLGSVDALIPVETAMLRFVLVASLVPVLSFVPVQEEGPTSSLVTLYASDDLLSSFSFSTGTHAARIEDGELILDDTQITFDILDRDCVTYGYVENQLIEIVDLGDPVVEGAEMPSDRSPKPPLSIFHTLFLKDGQVSYRGPIRRTYRFREGQAIFNSLPPERVRCFVPQVGHVYLLRYKIQGVPDDRRMLVKFRVIDYRPGETLTLRWAPLESV